MAGFFPALFEEMGARRKRLRAMFGDFGQALSEFLVLAGLGLGSVGLFVRPWMTAVTPWGLWLPLVFLIGVLGIEVRRQQRQAMSETSLSSGYDWVALLWSFACALAGVAAFVIAITGEPPPWQPSPGAVSVDIAP